MIGKGVDRIAGMSAGTGEFPRDPGVENGKAFSDGEEAKEHDALLPLDHR